MRERRAGEPPATLTGEFVPAKDLLWRHLRKRRLTVGDLARLLTGSGLAITEKALRRKMVTGAFTADFMLRCFESLSVDVLSLRCNTFIYVPPRSLPAGEAERKAA